MRPQSSQPGQTGRRLFLQLLAGEAASLHLPRSAAAAGPYQVGVGYSSSADGYAAATRAITACGQWPAAGIAGKVVMVKPNLVTPKPSTGGATTDPQVVRAIVDLALAAGASQVLVVESGPGQNPANFSGCGYDFFATYDPRVQLMDFSTQPAVAVPIKGLAYQSLYLPAPALQPNVFFISAGKLKCHLNAVASLSMKNLFGLAASNYKVVNALLRQDLHFRGVDESIVDLNLARPVNFAVIDGIWGMQGNGPLQGTPIQMDLALAGLNALAVDRVALAAMQLPQTGVPHLLYAAALGLGPKDLTTVTLLGDPLNSAKFTPAQTGPTVWRPTVNPISFSPRAAQQTTISYKLQQSCYAEVQIIQDSDSAPAVNVVRTVQPLTQLPAGTNAVVWDGRDDGGSAVAPGSYLARVVASYGGTGARITYTSSWVAVAA